jgi:hypothetical protein
VIAGIGHERVEVELDLDLVKQLLAHALGLLVGHVWETM